ncbi:hypothetical protein ACFL1J_06765 [Pseudomonadota bacterium]
MPNQTQKTYTDIDLQAFSTRARARARAKAKQEQEQEQGRKQEEKQKKEQGCLFFLVLLVTAQKIRRVFTSGFTHKKAALVMPKFGLTVEKRPGAAIKGGNTRIHLLADSELIQVKKSAAPVTARIPPEDAEKARLLKSPESGEH